MKSKVLSVISIIAAAALAFSCENLEELAGFLGDGSVKLTVTPATLNIPAAGGEGQFALTAPAAWSAQPNEDWITIDPAVGTSGDATVTVTASANTGGTRVAEITVESSGKDFTVTVIQAAGNSQGGGGSETDVPANAVWSLIGTVNGYDGQTDLPMIHIVPNSGAADFWYTVFYYKPGQNLRLRANGSDDYVRGGGAITTDSAQSATVNAVPGGGFMTLDKTNTVYELYYYPAAEQFYFKLPYDETWSMVGAFGEGDGVDWNKDYPMLPSIGEDKYGHNHIYYTTRFEYTGQEFKFRFQRGWDFDFGLPWDQAGGTEVDGNVQLQPKGANIILKIEGTYQFTLDPMRQTLHLVNENGQVVTGGNGSSDPTGSSQWSVVGSLNGIDWDTDLDMTWDGGLWKTTIYFRDGQEFKLRNNHSWSDNRGYGEIDPRHPVVEAVADGANIILPYAAYWDVAYDPAAETISVAPSKDVQWQYFLTPQGEKALIEFTQGFWGETAYGYIKYYEVDGIRTCMTETEKHIYKGEYYDGYGFWGCSAEPGEGEWTFIWYTSGNLIQLPAQFTGYHSSDYDADVWVYDDYAYEKYIRSAEGLNNWYEAATAPGTQYGSGYYDNNGGFYLAVARYYMDNVGGWNIYAYDNVGEAEGYERHDYAVDVETGTSRSGYVPVIVTAGQDVAYIKYAIVEGKVGGNDYEAICTEIKEGSRQSSELKDFTDNTNNKKKSARLTMTSDKQDYISIVGVAYDTNGNECWNFYYYQYLIPFDGSRTWKSLGTVSYTDDLFATLYAKDVLTWDVELQQCVQDTSVIRMVYPYDSKFAHNQPGDYATDKSYDIEIVIRDSTHVYILPQDTGVNWEGDGMTAMGNYAGFYLASAANEDQIKDEFYGTLHEEGFITFPSRGLLAILPDYSFSSWYIANAKEGFKLTMPNYVAPQDGEASQPATIGKKPTRKAGYGVLRRDEPAGGKGTPVKAVNTSSSKNRFSPID
ncbi:MAG: BACON domain-containing protein [Bacteroidales bacterium]|nr:BACON domain-containing protein [Bacteroidales bacterium]